MFQSFFFTITTVKKNQFYNSESHTNGKKKDKPSTILLDQIEI